MLHIFLWERRRSDRRNSFQALSNQYDPLEIKFEIDSISETLEELKENIFSDLSSDDVNVLFAHTSNIVKKEDFLSLISDISTSFPFLFIILYSGGNITILKNSGKIIFDDKEFSFNPLNNNAIYSVTAKYSLKNNFIDLINLRPAISVYQKTKNGFDFIDQILGLEIEIRKELDNFYYGKNLIASICQTKKYNALYIWDQCVDNTSFDTSNNLIQNSQALTNILSRPGALNNYDCVIILAELNWSDERQQFHGLKIGAELRKTEKYLGPIFFLSCYDIKKFEELFLTSHNVSFNILFAPASYLIKLKNETTASDIQFEILDQLKTTLKIDQATLHDINNMLLDETGELIDKLSHFLFIYKPREELSQILNICKRKFPKEGIYLNTLSHQILNSQKENDELTFYKSKNELLQFIEQRFSKIPYSISSDNLTQSNGRFKIVIVEDSIEYQETLRSKLGGKFNIQYFDSSHQAILQIREDIYLEIACVICDWRLLKPGSKNIWQEMQGYELLNQISLFHSASLVSLTSEIDTNVHAIRNLLNIKLTLFKKQYLQYSDVDNAWNIFSDCIEDLCSRAADLVASMPTGTSWTSENSKNKFVSLRTKYLIQRRGNWPSFENSITQEAGKCWNYYCQALSTKNPYLNSIESEYGLTLNENLKNILIVRRLWFGLWFKKDKINFIGRIFSEETPEINIYIILKSIDLDEEKQKPEKKYPVTNNETYDQTSYIPEWKEKLKNNANAFANTLCIVKSELPSAGLLPEEKNWLKELGIEIGKNANNYYE